MLLRGVGKDDLLDEVDSTVTLHVDVDVMLLSGVGNDSLLDDSDIEVISDSLLDVSDTAVTGQVDDVDMLQREVGNNEVLDDDDSVVVLLTDADVPPVTGAILFKPSDVAELMFLREAGEGDLLLGDAKTGSGNRVIPTPF